MNFFRRIARFVSALFRALRTRLSGKPVLLPPHSPLLVDRLKECDLCPRHKLLKAAGVVAGVCEECGCSTRVKASLLTEKCPLGRW